MKYWLLIRTLVVVGAIGVYAVVSGKDFGTMGHTFPIEEENILTVLQKNVSEKDSHRKLLKEKKRLLHQAKKPAPVQGLRETKKPRKFFVDLSFKIDRDITGSKGSFIVKSGTSVNPLERVTLTSGVLFFDGSQKTHVDWAKQQIGDFKWVLTQGEPIVIEELERRPVYFDQNGIYTSRFKIEQIPAKVTQNGKYLLVQEVIAQEKDEEK
jgi:conjugal transfer pilus assembly protein TraW